MELLDRGEGRQRLEDPAPIHAQHPPDQPRWRRWRRRHGTPPPPPPPAQPFQIRTAEFAPGAVGVAYHDLVRVSGGSVSSWTISAGALPPGLTFVGGEISGTPRTVGVSSFTVMVGDGTRTVEKALSIRVVPAVTVSVPTITPVVLGDRFEAHPTVKGGAAPYRWTVTGTTGGQVGVAADGTISG